MDDYISRKTALATVLSMYSRCDTNSLEDYRDLMVESVNVLPAADVVKNVKAKWLVYDEDECGNVYVWKCSECGEEVDMVRHNYCPNCGARMEGRDETD